MNTVWKKFFKKPSRFADFINGAFFNENISLMKHMNNSRIQSVDMKEVKMSKFKDKEKRSIN